MMQRPTGRGAWIWHLLGNNGVAPELAAAVARCSAAKLTHVFVDAGSTSLWGQFNKPMVEAFHAAGIMVFGWGYQMPGVLSANAAVIQLVHDCGADGFCIDAEKEWQGGNAEEQAQAYADAIRALHLSDYFLVGHAPFDVISLHQQFPYTVLGAVCDFVAPQAYWSEHCMSVENSTARALGQWAAYRTKHPDSCRSLAPIGYCVKPDSGYHAPTPAEVATFERMCKAAGCASTSLWRFDGIAPAVFAWLCANGWASGGAQ
jgi:hypothetical protein